MKNIKKLSAIMLSVVTMLMICSTSASALEEVVTISNNQTYSLSDSMQGYCVHILKTRTNNSKNSSQDLRAHCHYRTNIFQSWSYDSRVFIAPGKSLLNDVSSTRFETVKYWRLGLSPRIESNKGVSGNGVIKTQ